MGIQNNQKICGSACISQLHSSTNKVQPNLFCVLYNSLQNVPGCIHQGFIQFISHPLCLSTGFIIVTEILFVVDISFYPFWKFLWVGNSALGLIFGPGIFLGCVGSPRDFFGFDFSPHSIIPVT